jgi:hypothetical protein
MLAMTYPSSGPGSVPTIQAFAAMGNHARDICANTRFALWRGHDES